jgi:HEPN domain-containing protein
MRSTLEVARGLILKADNDLKAVRIGIQHDVPLDTIAFHVQQSAEKMLKALLALRGVDYPLTHDLRVLLNLAVKEVPGLDSFRERIIAFNPYAVELRYDVIELDREEIVRALSTVEGFRNAILDNIPEEAAREPCRADRPVDVASCPSARVARAASRHRGSGRFQTSLPPASLNVRGAFNQLAQYRAMTRRLVLAVTPDAQRSSSG